MWVADLDDDIVPESPPWRPGEGPGIVGALGSRREPVPDDTDTGPLTDPLTGLPTDAGIHQILHRRAAVAHDEELPLSVLLVELDEVGDEVVDDDRAATALPKRPSEDVLLDAVDRLTAAIGSGDAIGRSGSRMFLIVRLNGDRPSSDALADRIVRAMEHAPHGDADGWKHSVAIGVATMDSTSPSYDADLLVDAARGQLRIAQLAGTPLAPRPPGATNEPGRRSTNVTELAAARWRAAG